MTLTRTAGLVIMALMEGHEYKDSEERRRIQTALVLIVFCDLLTVIKSLYTGVKTDTVSFGSDEIFDFLVYYH